jgi:predicted membrane protein
MASSHERLAMWLDKTTNPKLRVFMMLYALIYQFTIGRFSRLMALMHASYTTRDCSHVCNVVKLSVVTIQTAMIWMVLAVLGYGTGIYKQVYDFCGGACMLLGGLLLFMIVFWFNIPGTPESNSV